MKTWLVYERDREYFNKVDNLPKITVQADSKEAAEFIAIKKRLFLTGAWAVEQK